MLKKLFIYQIFFIIIFNVLTSNSSELPKVATNPKALNIILLTESGSNELEMAKNGETASGIDVLVAAVSQGIYASQENGFVIIMPIGMLNVFEIGESFFEKNNQEEAYSNDFYNTLTTIEKSWNTYFNEDGSLAVLVPKKMSIGKCKKTLKSLGFNSESFIHNKERIEEIKESITDEDAQFDEFSISDFKNLFDKEINIGKRIFFSGHGSPTAIAGIPVKEKTNQQSFNSLLEALTKIKTEYLYIDSCFAGGKAVELNEMMRSVINQSSTTIEFPVVIAGIINAPTSSPYALPYEENIGEEIAGKEFLLFFQRLNDFLHGNPPYKKGGIFSGYGLYSVVEPFFNPKNPDLQNLASVRLAGYNSFFRAINLKKTYALTYVGLKRLSLELVVKDIVESGKHIKIFGGAKHVEPSIDLNNLDAILFYPSIMDRLLLTYKHKAPSPLFVSKIMGAAFHILGKIEISNIDIPQFVLSGFFYAPEYSSLDPKAWFIKELKSNERTLKNLLVITSSNEVKKGYNQGIIVYNEHGKFYKQRVLVPDQNKPLRLSDAIEIPKNAFFIVAMFVNGLGSTEKALYEATAGNETQDFVRNSFVTILDEQVPGYKDLVKNAENIQHILKEDQDKLADEMDFLRSLKSENLAQEEDKYSRGTELQKEVTQKIEEENKEEFQVGTFEKTESKEKLKRQMTPSEEPPKKKQKLE